MPSRRRRGGHCLPGRDGGPGCAREHVITPGRHLRGPPPATTNRRRATRNTDARTLADAVNGADVFLGCSPPACSRPRWSRPWPTSPSSWHWPTRARDPPRAGQGRTPRLHHRHRPLGLPEPGQQRPVLPVHLPRRRTGLRRDQDHRGHEARLRAPDRRAGQGRTSAKKWPTPTPARSWPSAPTT